MRSEHIRDWLFIAAIAVAFGVVPAIVYLRPPQLGFRATFIVFPVLPAIGLAAVAVWYALTRE